MNPFISCSVVAILQRLIYVLLLLIPSRLFTYYSARKTASQHVPISTPGAPPDPPLVPVLVSHLTARTYIYSRCFEGREKRGVIDSALHATIQVQTTNFRWLGGLFIYPVTSIPVVL